MDEWKRDSEIEKKEENNVQQSWMRMGHKKEIFLVFLVFLGMLAFLWPDHIEEENKNRLGKIQEDEKIEDFTQDIRYQMTKDVENILSGMKGIGRVKVCLTLDSDGIRKYAVNQSRETQEKQELVQNDKGNRKEILSRTQTDLAVSGGGAVLVEQVYPQVVGVLVVAEGAENAVLQQKISDAVSVLLNISPHRVRVLAGGNGKS